MNNNHYVYLHVKESNGHPFYVGKGVGTRAYTKFSRNNHWINIVKKHGYDIIFLEENLSEEESLERECYWIERIGRIDIGTGPLCNQTSGGEYPIYGPGSCKKMSESGKGKKLKDETREKISNGLKSRWEQGFFENRKQRPPTSEETKKKISQSNILRYERDGTNPLTEEQKKNLSEKAKERWKSGRYSNRKRNKPISEESRNRFKEISKSRTRDNNGKFIKTTTDNGN